MVLCLQTGEILAARSFFSGRSSMPINLLYHDLTAAGHDDASGFPGPGAARYKLTPEEFERHLERIASVTRQPPLMTTSPDVLSGTDLNAWAMTFDDGGSSAITEIAEQLERRRWRGWFFVATDFIGKPSFCTREQVRELHDRGHIIGSHSSSHPERISRCSWDQLVDEWTRSCSVLAEIIEQPVTTASVPGGFYSRTVARAASHAGIKVLFNSEPTVSLTRVGETLILGRYNIYRGMSDADAASLVNSPLRRLRQAAFWNVKKFAKILVGPLYKIVRQRVLTRKYSDVQSSRGDD